MNKEEKRLLDCFKSATISHVPDEWKKVIPIGGNSELPPAEWKGSNPINTPGEWRGVTSVVTPSGVQEMAVLSEPGLYADRQPVPREEAVNG